VDWFFFLNVTLFQVSVVQYASCVQRYLHLAFVVTRFIPNAMIVLCHPVLQPVDAVALYSVGMIQYFRTSRYVPIFGRPLSGWASTCLRV
jgi:hypothetical protein